MKKIILTVLALSILMLPCFLMFNEPVDATGEWHYVYNLIGVVYTCIYFHAIKLLFK